VLERIDVAFGCLLDELPVKALPAGLLVKNPLGAELTSVAQPIRNPARQAADSCSGEAASAEMMERPQVQSPSCRK